MNLWKNDLLVLFWLDVKLWLHWTWLDKNLPLTLFTPRGASQAHRVQDLVSSIMGMLHYSEPSWESIFHYYLDFEGNLLFSIFRRSAVIYLENCRWASKAPPSEWIRCKNLGVNRVKKLNYSSSGFEIIFAKIII